VLSEARKITVVKTPRMLTLIKQLYCQGRLGNNVNDDLINELMLISIHAMIAELQLNPHEGKLRRLVDFGHEFCNVIEAGARHELPHGECIAIGMASLPRITWNV
jgi:3-dehydroquinate synthetase